MDIDLIQYKQISVALRISAPLPSYLSNNEGKKGPVVHIPTFFYIALV